MNSKNLKNLIRNKLRVIMPEMILIVLFQQYIRLKQNMVLSRILVILS